DRVVVPIQGVNLFHFSTPQQGPQPPNPLAGSLESRIRWRVGHFHPAPGSKVNRPQQGRAQTISPPVCARQTAWSQSLIGRAQTGAEVRGAGVLAGFNPS